MRIWCLVMSLLATSAVYAESFVLPKKKQSTRNAKESCNDLLFDALKISPSLSKHNADVQLLGLDLAFAMLDGSFFSGMSKAEVENCCNELTAFYLRQEKINALLEEQRTVLRQLKKKFPAHA